MDFGRVRSRLKAIYYAGRYNHSTHEQLGGEIESLKQRIQLLEAAYSAQSQRLLQLDNEQLPATQQALIQRVLLLENWQAATIPQALNDRVTLLENWRTMMDNWRLNTRFMAIELLTEYLMGAQVPGDYMEFGVYKGTTFSYAYKYALHLLKDIRFVAFDSFEGLPKPQGLDAVDGYSSGFYEGEFAVSQDEFIENLKTNGVDLSRVVIVPGWFDQTLTSENAASHQIDKAAAAWVDCDLYESTVPVLKFLTTRLSVGSVILFDDWRCFRNLPDYGVQKACREWLEANPNIQLRELFSFGWNGLAFTVSSI